MARIDFYVLQESGELSRRRFACRLAEKAYKLQHSVHIVTGSNDAAAGLDELLWTFRDGSFVPHEVVDAGSGPVESPVTISVSPYLPESAHLLINLGDAVPVDVERFERIAEVVSNDDECKSHSRTRFVDYRAGGHTLDTHNL